MNHPEVWILAAAAIFGISVYALIVRTHLLRQLLALKVMGNAAFLVLVVGAGTVNGLLDGIPKALVLTGIVIAIAAIGFALAVLVRLAEVTGSLDLDQDPSEPESVTGTDGDKGGDESGANRAG